MQEFSVLLYYIYSPIENVVEYRDIHHQFCLDNELLGRIIVAPEGLNGTVSGTKENCEAYMKWVKSDPRFTTIDFKVEKHEGHAFKKLYVRIKKEIVHSELPVDPRIQTGKHLEPAEFKQMLNDEDVVLVDMRSNYEHNVGRFKGAVTFDMENLRELPDHMHEIEHLKNKKVITYCTGGIKCEKASAYLLQQGFENVYQLHGGIIKYGLEEGGENFDGKCYVFDGRLTTDVNKVNPEVISTCHVCGEKCDRMVNCANPECNEHMPMCEKCGEEMEGACSAECKEHPKKRPYDGTGYYQKDKTGYKPEIAARTRKNTKKLHIVEKLGLCE
ncbi:oxygen-dependent tRNA uridine(34) hydroxylase TrhO [Jiulongibacter sediminis]|uniref:tRNA uridine(34) hydroxylase n=1 Tax=Jiulongibacter sediminis TaxID=1605367 RepID=A0A0P7CA04_9BACT|nr:rhodanese-related sulfurtransferase [Jiulongibacter sediminis]KPM49400.1 sulfurtransferase [Jiulongibacter sediminis]TBX26450.1 sulfurtransferase [Jiulongibacter sediminis]